MLITYPREGIRRLRHVMRAFLSSMTTQPGLVAPHVPLDVSLAISQPPAL